MPESIETVYLYQMILPLEVFILGKFDNSSLTFSNSKDENKNPLTTEFGYCTYRDFQMIYIQEMPERSPAGQMPRPVDVICDDDLVDKVKPGDRVVIVGTYRSRGKNQASQVRETTNSINHQSAVFSTLLLANNISLLNKDITKPSLTETDAREIRKIGKR